MKRLLVSVCVLLFIFVFGNAETEFIDVTGDDVDDEIKIGEKSVIVVDGALGKRWVVYQATDDEYESESIDGCVGIRLGNKIGLQVNVYSYGAGAMHGNFGDLIFLHRGNQFVEIPFDGAEIVETGISHPRLGTIYLTLHRLGMIESFLYWNGKQLKEMSEGEDKESRKQFEAAIKNIMHTVQLAAEDYCTITEGVYPDSVSEFAHLLPDMINPVDYRSPAVIDGSFGSPGQVGYEYNSRTDKYKIYGFDLRGEQLSLILSNDY